MPQTEELELALGAGALLQLLRPHVALAVNRWRARHGLNVRVWVETAAQFEALSSLSSYRYEHPEDPFPEIVSPGDAPRSHALFEGTQLGHPLWPRATEVRNDVRLVGDLQLLVISGSNMSGKSTLLRTVGINAVLALAGAPVRAASLRLSPVAIGGTLRIQDSLLDGRSRFYCTAERSMLSCVPGWFATRVSRTGYVSSLSSPRARRCDRFSSATSGATR